MLEELITGDAPPLERASGESGIWPQDFRLGVRNVCFSLNFNPSRLDGLVDDAGELGTELVGDDSTEELPVAFEESEYTLWMILDEELGIKRVMLVLE